MTFPKSRTGLRKENWKAIRCPQGCGAWWKHEIHIRSGGACCRVYWHRKNLPWSRAPFENKPCATFRVMKDENGEWMKHPTNPAWNDNRGGAPLPVKRCC